jgi:hypothetical protein
MKDEASPSHNADAGRGLSEGLGANAEPTSAEDRAFWANLVIANVWFATGDGVLGPWPGLLHLLICFSIRWPYWQRQYFAAKSA